MHRNERPGRRALRAATRITILACAVSAGVHAGLVPEHLEESTSLGLSFVVAVALLALVAAALAFRPDDGRVAAAAALLMAGLILSWAASRTTGLPVLEPDPEPVGALDLVTKVIEALGFATALWLSGQSGGRRPSPIEEQQS
jgi:hypothetical protein